MNLLVLALAATAAAADPDPLKPARIAFGEGDADQCLELVGGLLAGGLPSPLVAKAQFLRAQCVNQKDGPSRASQALEAAMEADPELVVDAARVDPQLVGLFEGLRQRGKAEVAIASDKPDSVVLLDGAETGSAPMTLKVPPGRHRIVVRTRDGRFSKERELVLYPKRSYELSLELGPTGLGSVEQPPAPVGRPPWMNGLFLDARTRADPGKGVGFTAGVGWSGELVSASLDFVLGGYLGAVARFGGRVGVADGRLTLGANLEATMFGVPAQGSFAGGVAGGLGGFLEAATRLGPVEPFVELGAQSILSAPAAAAAVPATALLVGAGLRVYLP